MQPDTTDRPSYSFTAAELARLTAYREAVRAGFYNDDGGASGAACVAEAATGTVVTTWAGHEAEFTPKQLARLAAYRAAIAAGFFNEELAQTPSRLPSPAHWTTAAPARGGRAEHV